MGEQQIDHGLSSSTCSRVVERCGANMGLGVHMSAMLQQQGDDRRIAASRRDVQWRPAVSVSGVDLRTLGQQRFHLSHIACLRRLQQHLASALCGLTLAPTDGQDHHSATENP